MTIITLISKKSKNTSNEQSKNTFLVNLG